MNTTSSELTAKDFRRPLLIVMGTLTKMSVTAAIPFDKTYTPVFSMMGIQPTEELEKRIIWCFSDLKAKGFGHSPGRGKWSLTHQGVEEARLLQGTPTREESEVEEALEGLMGGGTSPRRYHPDPYIRSLGLTGHPCLGFITPNSPVCDSCTAQVECGQERIVKLTLLAEHLAKEDRAGESYDQNAGDVDEGVYEVVYADQQEQPPPPHPKGKKKATPASLFLCQVECPCAKCDLPILVGSSAYWDRTKQGGKTNKYHPECYQKG